MDSYEPKLNLCGNFFCRHVLPNFNIIHSLSEMKHARARARAQPSHYTFILCTSSNDSKIYSSSLLVTNTLLENNIF